MNEAQALLSLILAIVLILLSGDDIWRDYYYAIVATVKRLTATKKESELFKYRYEKKSSEVAPKEKVIKLSEIRDQYIFIHHKKIFSRQENRSAYSKKGKTVFCLFLDKKDRQSRSTMLTCGLCIFLYNALSIWDLLSFESWLVFAFFAFGIATKIDFYFAKKRGYSGEYGGNRFEAEELIKFIVDHSEKSDFGGPGGKIKLMPDNEKADESESLWGGVKDGQ